MIILDYLKLALKYPKQHIEIFGAQYYLFTCFAVIYFGMPFQFWSGISTEHGTLSIFILTTASTLSFFLIFKDSLPEKIKSFFPLYWYMVLMYCLPFTSTYMMFKGMISFPWFFLSIFLLSILVNWISFMIITLTGFFIALLLIGLNDGIIYLPSNTSDQNITAYTCIFAILIISLFLRNRDNIMNGRIKAYQDLSGYIAHEMRKPLAFIRTSCEGFEKYSPQLFEAYEAAIKAKVYNNEINTLVINVLKELPSEFKKTSSDGLLFIEMLLVQTQSSFEAGRDFKFGYALDNINRTIKRWESGIDRIAKINLKTDYNFKYYGIPILLDHILLELFRNSEYFIGNKKDAQINIWCSSLQMNNEIHFMDNGCGIDDNNLKQVFKNGFSKRRYGTGIGLGFCKAVMKQMGGNIRILSKSGFYTEVILSFPMIQGDVKDV